MIGAYATAIISGSILSDGALVYSVPGDPLSAFIAALAGIAVGSLPAGKTKLDLLITLLSPLSRAVQWALSSVRLCQRS